MQIENIHKINPISQKYYKSSDNGIDSIVKYNIILKISLKIEYNNQLGKLFKIEAIKYLLQCNQH